MAGLQRSAISFRRQGSSGLVWDDNLISEPTSTDTSEQQQTSDDQKDHQKPGSRRTKSDGEARRSTYRTVKVEQADDPPSPRLSGCVLCSVFGRPSDVKTNANKKSGKVK